MTQKKMFLAAVVLLIAAFIASVFVYNKQKAEQAAQVAAQNQAALVRADAPSFGNPNAPVHIVEFLDPACETCREFYPLVKALMEAHPGKIRMSVRYTPFHPGSDTVVKALEAARKQGQFKQALEALFVAQNGWVKNHTAQADLIWPYLEPLGLDMVRLKSDMNLPEVASMITRDLADAKTMNVTMTPEFFVNGKPLPSFGFDQLKNLVDEALANTTAK